MKRHKAFKSVKSAGTVLESGNPYPRRVWLGHELYWPRVFIPNPVMHTIEIGDEYFSITGPDLVGKYKPYKGKVIKRYYETYQKQARGA